MTNQNNQCENCENIKHGSVIRVDVDGNCMICGKGRFLQTEDSDWSKELIEKLADIEHQRWAGWQAYLHSKTYLIPATMGNRGITYIDFERWERQINTPYEKLSEKEKQSDRDQVMRYWPLISNLVKQVKEKAVLKGERNRIIMTIKEEQKKKIVEKLEGLKHIECEEDPCIGNLYLDQAIKAIEDGNLS